MFGTTWHLENLQCPNCNEKFSETVTGIYNVFCPECEMLAFRITDVFDDRITMERFATITNEPFFPSGKYGQ